MPTPIILNHQFIAGTSAVIRALLTDDQDPPVGFQPTTLKVTLKDIRTGTVINGRNDTALSPVSDYVSSVGVLTFNLTRLDNIIVTSGKNSETHRLHFLWEWGGGSPAVKAGVQDIDFEVVLDTPGGPTP